MLVKTSEVKPHITIRIIPKLKECNSTETLIRQRILDTPYKLWTFNEYNVIDLMNGEVADIFVFEGVNNTIFIVNSIF